MLILAVLHVFPGLEKTVLTNDLAAQYTDFFSYFKSFFTGENNLLYCLSQTLGNNMWGLLPYYLLSPFNFILLFFTSSQLPTAIFIMTILKIGACGLTSYIFLNRVFRKDVYKRQVPEQRFPVSQQKTAVLFPQFISLTFPILNRYPY